MSPEQLKKLKNLSNLFENGAAGANQIQQLSELLACVNNNEDMKNHFENVQSVTPTPYIS